MFAMVEGEFINLQKVIKVSRLSNNNAFCIIYDSKEHPLDLYRFDTKDEAEDKYRKIIEAINRTIGEKDSL